MVRRACVTHALHLWGLTNDAPHLRFTVTPKTAAATARQEGARKRATALGKTLTDFFNTGPHPALLREGGRLFNVLGGIFVKVQADPNSTYSCGLSLLPPEAVFPVWDPINYERLLRCHIIANLDVAIARALYGYKGEEEGGTVEYVETWTPEAWQVTLGFAGSGTRTVARNPATGEELRGPNNFRDPTTDATRIPIVYIPRLRTGRFWGLSLADELLGLQDEFNSRMADYGDAVSFAAQMHVWGSDLSRKRTPGPLRLPIGTEIFDAGDTGPNGKPPQLSVLAGPNISTSTAAFTDKVEATFYDQASISPVMRGLDEGSQRSGATLAARAIPTLSIVDDYRTSWGYGGIQLAELVLLFAYNYNNGDLADLKVDRNTFGHRLKPGFAPVLPRDIEAINQTITAQRGAGVMSLKRAVNLSPDVEDPEAELIELAAEQAAAQAEKLATMEAEAKVQAANRPAAANGGSNGGS